MLSVCYWTRPNHYLGFTSADKQESKSDVLVCCATPHFPDFTSHVRKFGRRDATTFSWYFVGFNIVIFTERPAVQDFSSWMGRGATYRQRTLVLDEEEDEGGQNKTGISEQSPDYGLAYHKS